MNSKYLKYALGEIILVVIGILIALSINNWNEERKDRSFERNILSEIKVALDNDINYTQRNIKRLESLDSAIDVMLYLIEQKADFIDSLYNQDQRRSYMLATGIIYQYNQGPFEALKSNGLDKIENDSLRNSLIYLYDFDFPRHKEFIQYYDQDYKEQIDRWFGFQGEPFIENINGERFIRQKFPKDLLQNSDFLYLLNEMRSRARIELNSFKNFIPRLKSIQRLITNELNS
ncbi:MAG: hypothetical protein HWE21_11840 [Cytophagia bacterium]|nr:hypothetical protein [Cytophagia bacterium]